MFTAGRYLLTEQFRLNEQDLLALCERHGYDLVLLEGFGDSGWAKIEVVRSSVIPVGGTASCTVSNAKIHFKNRSAYHEQP